MPKPETNLEEYGAELAGGVVAQRLGERRQLLVLGCLDEVGGDVQRLGHQARHGGAHAPVVGAQRLGRGLGKVVVVEFLPNFLQIMIFLASL